MNHSILFQAAGISPGHSLAQVLAGRSDIVALTDSSHDAALKPVPSGGLSHSERAALACRIARLNQEDSLAAHFEGMIGDTKESTLGRKIADPGFQGDGDVRLQAIIRHTDLVAKDPKEATRSDIAALESAGINQEDIVRLSELIAFVSYLVRVVAGLKLMAGVV